MARGLADRAAAGQRVRLLDDPGQAVGLDVGVDLGRADVGMAEQGLDDAQIGAALQQMGREGVADDMRRHPRGRWTLDSDVSP